MLLFMLSRAASLSPNSLFICSDYSFHWRNGSTTSYCVHHDDENFVTNYQFFVFFFQVFLYRFHRCLFSILHFTRILTSQLTHQPPVGYVLSDARNENVTQSVILNLERFSARKILWLKDRNEINDFDTLHFMLNAVVASFLLFSKLRKVREEREKEKNEIIINPINPV